MELDIIKEKETPLLSRKRVTAWVNYEGATPSRVEMVKEFAKKAKVAPEKIIIKHMYTRFGQQDLKLIVNIYNNPENLKRLEPENLVEKHKPAWQEKKSESKESEEKGIEEKASETKDNKEEQAPQDGPSEEKTEVKEEVSNEKAEGKEAAEEETKEKKE